MQNTTPIAYQSLLPLLKLQSPIEKDRNSTAVSGQDLAVSVIIAF